MLGLRIVWATPISSAARTSRCSCPDANSVRFRFSTARRAERGGPEGPAARRLMNAPAAVVVTSVSEWFSATLLPSLPLAATAADSTLERLPLTFRREQ